MIDFEFMVPFVQVTLPPEPEVPAGADTVDITFKLAFMLPAARGIYLDNIFWKENDQPDFHLAEVHLATSNAFLGERDGFNFIMEFGSFTQTIPVSRLDSYPKNLPGRVMVHTMFNYTDSTGKPAKEEKKASMALADAAIGDDPNIQV